MTGIPLERPTRPRRIPVWGKVVVGVVLLAIAWAILFPSSNTVKRHTEYCTGCIAYRITTMKGFWFDDHRLLDLGATEEIQGSAVLREVFGGNHAHRWGNNGMSGALLGLRTFIACDHPHWNPVAHWLEVDDGFRAATLKSVAEGRLTREGLREILELPSEPDASTVAVPACRMLFERGQEMLRGSAYGEDRHWAAALGSEAAVTSPGPK